jgi:hypothetical protein
VKESVAYILLHSLFKVDCETIVIAHHLRLWDMRKCEDHARRTGQGYDDVRIGKEMSPTPPTPNR